MGEISMLDFKDLVLKQRIISIEGTNKERLHVDCYTACETNYVRYLISGKNWSFYVDTLDDVIEEVNKIL